MKYRNLGRSGLQVSELCFGCMTFGKPGKGLHAWTLDEEASRPLIKQAVEVGLTSLIRRMAMLRASPRKYWVQR